eukprot:s873_g10.t1
MFRGLPSHVPTLYVLTSDSALALITGKGGTFKKYTLEKEEAERGAGGIEPLPIWGQDSLQGDYMEFMGECKRHMSWWNDQLMELGVDQAAIVGEPDEMVYGLGMTFTHWMGNFKSWFHTEIVPKNNRFRWIRNIVLPPSLELRDMFHGLESEFNRRQMLEYYNLLFHLLHVTHILKPQIDMAKLKPVRPAEDCIFRDVIPRKDEMPDTVQNLVRDADVKVSIPTEYTAAIVGEPSTEAAAASSSSSGAPPKAAVAGAPALETVIEGTVTPKFTIRQVPSYRFTQEENVKGEVVEHVVVEQHPYEMVIRSCWEMSGAENLRFPARLANRRTKVNAVTRGQPGQDVSKFDEGMWLDLDVFMELYTTMFPKKVNPPSVGELVALLYKDNKARFEVKRAAGLQKATHKGFAYWPFKIRAVQGHSEKAVKRAAASDMFNAVMIYAETGADAVKKVSLTGTPATAGNQDGVVFIRTASDGILTKDTIDPKFIISIEDTVNKEILFQRKDTAQSTAKSSGEGAQGKQKIEGKAQTLAQSSAPASAASI